MQNMNAAAMRLIGPSGQPVCQELDLLQDLVPLTGATVLELGCGAAEKTRQIAARTGVAGIVGAEVDRRQHDKNLRLTDLPNVRFEAFGAEAIAAPDSSFDLVLMFKSLHHVPGDVLDTAFQEMHRVLRPDGLIWISEPVFDGAFNEVLRLFHDEQQVRQAAFDAIRRAVGSGLFELVTERFFLNPLRFASFEQFEAGVINVTHTQHHVTPELRTRIRARFEASAKPDGYHFLIPNRVDLLRRLPDPRALPAGSAD